MWSEFAAGYKPRRSFKMKNRSLGFRSVQGLEKRRVKEGFLEEVTQELDFEVHGRVGQLDNGGGGGGGEGVSGLGIVYGKGWQRERERENFLFRKFRVA